MHRHFILSFTFSLVCGLSSAQAPAGTTPLSTGPGSQTEAANAALDKAEGNSNNMPDGIFKEAVKAAIANIRKMLAAGRVLNDNGATGRRGTSAGTTQEAIENGQAIHTSSVGVGTEYVTLGDKVLTQSADHAGGTLVHEGVRCKQEGKDTIPPPAGGGGGGGGGQPPLWERRAEWLRDWDVYTTDAYYWDGVAAGYAGQPARVEWAQKFAELRRETANDRARRYNRSF
jgi:hypothetical protein